MIFARAICQDRPEDLELAFARLGLPRSAREYLLEKIPHAQVLLTGLSRTEGRFLRGLADAPPAPGYEEFPTHVPGDVQKRPGTALLCGRRDQLERVREAAAKDPELSELAAALSRLLSLPGPGKRVLLLPDRALELGRRTLVMGVVNVTPDSFSDGGSYLDPERAVAHGEALARAGADLLDVGGESSRPGAAPVSTEEELRRVIPVVRQLRRATVLPISVDTTKVAVAEEALACGASLVNDISGLRSGPDLAKAVARAGAALCVMHMQGSPQTMQAAPRYADVVEEVLAFLHGAARAAHEAGVGANSLLVDPGIGFGKTPGHNLVLLRRLGDLRQLGHPVLVGTSRKSFLGTLTGGKPPGERLWATLASVAAVAALGTADVVRVHDVAEVRDGLAVADAVRQAAEAGDSFGPPGAGEQA